MKKVLLVALLGVMMAVATAASPGVTGVAQTAPCGPDVGVKGALCGTLAVPLDRADPKAGTIPIAFELYPRSDASKPSLGTIVPSLSGPGIANSSFRGLWLGLFGPLLKRRDMLLVVHRGTGKSAAIDCPALQHFKGKLAAAVRACAASLGAAAGRYGSGESADDVDAVRAALGIDKIDYWGGSYGGVDVRAYAYRHPDHLRSAILDSPWPSTDEVFERSHARWYGMTPATVCRRSPSCVAANRDPKGTIAWLAARLRAHPFNGVGYDADGHAHSLHVDEASIIQILAADHYAEPPLLNYGELTAAAVALRAGDRMPLLRLTAESPVSVDSGDPTGFISVGAQIATLCSDERVPWDRKAPEAARRAQFNAAWSALPRRSYAPFSAPAWREVNGPVGTLGGFPPDACVAWPPTRPNPPFPPNQTVPKTPALILGGDMDVIPLPDSRALLRRFPKGRFVEIANAGHVTGPWSPCAQAITLRFIATLRTGDTSCAANIRSPFHGAFAAPTNFVPYHGVGRFPTSFSAARPALVDASGKNRANITDRRIVSAAWGAVEDAFLRAARMSGKSGRGVRGGSYALLRTEKMTEIAYHGVLFTRDVAVNGKATLSLATDTLDAQVTLNGPRSELGSLSFRGTLFDPAKPNAQVRGTVRGRRVALLVPTN